MEKKKKTYYDIGRRPPTKELADAIIATRVHNSFTQSAFSRYLNRTVGTIARWELARITPQPGVLSELLLIAPLNARHVLEDYLNKTYDQVLRERYLALVRNEKPKVWKANPEAHANDIYRAIQARAQWIWGEARIVNRQALAELVGLYELASAATERIKNGNSG